MLPPCNTSRIRSDRSLKPLWGRIFSESLPVGLILSFFLFMGGCSRVYYATMESIGIEKRDLFTSRIERAEKAQEDGKEQFVSALTRFKETVKYDGGDLEDKYNILRVELERSEDAASTIAERVEQVDSVAEALFDEWEAELDQYSREDFKRLSRAKLHTSKAHYSRLYVKMSTVVKSTEPVLEAFRDHVLYLKHNLNTRAVQSLQLEVPKIEEEVETLVNRMDEAILEASNFLQDFERDGPT